LDRVRDFVMDLVGEGATAPKLRDGELEAVGLPGPGPAPVREPEGVLDTVREPEPAPPHHVDDTGKRIGVWGHSGRNVKFELENEARVV
jgi:hypothetical protein